MQTLEGDFGVDFIFFDGEEFVIQRQRDPMFLGSTYFSNEYAAGKLIGNMNTAILVDMVADKDLQLYLEGNSLGYADGLTRSVWTVAQQLGVNEFHAEQRHKIRDDHLPLNSIARIPTCDIIDFDYPNPTQGKYLLAYSKGHNPELFRRVPRQSRIGCLRMDQASPKPQPGEVVCSQLISTATSYDRRDRLPIPVIAAFENIRSYALVLGIGGFAGGILSVHQPPSATAIAVLASDADERTRAFEQRKYRRRAIVGAMIASVGCMMAALYWVSDARIYSAFILMILTLLLGIMGLARLTCFPLVFSRSGTPDKDAEKKMIEEYLRQREKAAKVKEDEG